MKLAVVIVTFNRIMKLRTTLLRTLSESVDVVVVVDNNSTDGTIEWLESQTDKRLAIVKLTENAGGAGGFYVAFEYVVNNTDCDWFCCYDDDAYPENGVFERFRKLDVQGYDGIAGAVYLPDGTVSEMNRPFRSPFRRVSDAFRTLSSGSFLMSTPDKDYESRSFLAIHGASFVGLFLRRKSVLNRFGFPRKDLFIYGDDAIYTCKITRESGRLAFSPQLKFVHDCASLSADKLVSPEWKLYYLYRNGLEWLREESTFWYWILMPVKCVLWAWRAKYARNRRIYFKILFVAVHDAIKHRFDRSHAAVVALTDN